MYVTVRCEMVPRSVSSKHPSQTHLWQPDARRHTERNGWSARASGASRNDSNWEKEPNWNLKIKYEEPSAPVFGGCCEKKETVWYLLPLAVS